MEHQMDYWIGQGIDHFVLSVGYRHEAIVNHFGNGYRSSSIDYVIEATQLGTGGGLLLAAEYIEKGKPFLLLNGDTYFSIDLQRLMNFSSAHKADWCFSLFQAHEKDRYMGLEISNDGAITSMKSGLCKPGGLANGGVYWVTPSAMLNEKFSPDQKISLEDDVFPTAISMGQRLFGMEFSTSFIDIGIPEDFFKAQRMLEKPQSEN